MSRRDSSATALRAVAGDSPETWVIPPGSFGRSETVLAVSSVAMPVDRLILEELRRAPSGRWQDGRRRRVYRITRAGEELLRRRRLEVRSIARR